MLFFDHHSSGEQRRLRVHPGEKIWRRHRPAAFPPHPVQLLGPGRYVPAVWESRMCLTGNCSQFVCCSSLYLNLLYISFNSFSSVRAGNWSATASAGRCLWTGCSMQGLCWKELTADSDHPHPEASSPAWETPSLILFAVLHPRLQGGSKTHSVEP